MKLFEVEITAKVYVMAESVAEAESAADDWDVKHDAEYGSWARHVATSEDNECLPYGVPDDDHRRDWTIQQWIDSGELEMPPVRERGHGCTAKRSP